MQALLSFRDYPIWINLIVFTGAAAVIWYAGSRLERYTDAISERTKLGKAFLGLLLLAIATDLPEVATTSTAVLGGNRDLALHNLFGSIIIQTAILAGVDVLVSKGALTRHTPSFVLLIQGVGLILVIAAALVGMHMDKALSSALNSESSLLRIGFGPLAAFAAYLLAIYMTHRLQEHPRWLPVGANSVQDQSPEELEQKYLQELQKSSSQSQERQRAKAEEKSERIQSRPWRQVLLAYAGFALMVLAAGWLVTRVGEAVAEQTGLGASFIGITLLSIATSLPEISTATSAVRNGNYSLAYSNIFGSNAFDVALLLLVALLYPGILFQDVPVSIVFAAGMGIVMTCVLLWGLLERRDWTIFRLGWDSVVVLILYLAGTVIFYFLR